MARNRFLRAAVVSAALSALAPAAPLCAAPANAPAANPVTNLESTLNTSNQQSARNEAAQRLLEIDTPAARAVLRGAILSNDERARLAAARALDDDPSPDPGLVEPLGALLRRDPKAAEAAARALANYAANGTRGAENQLLGFITGEPRPPVASRAAAVRAAGVIVDKPVAETLVNLLNNPSQEAAIRNAAGDALVDMTGLTSNDRDARIWSQWYNANAAKPAPAWRADVIAQSYAQLQREHERLRQLRRDVSVLLHGTYDATPDDRKPAVLLGYLNSTDPDIRQIGAEIVPDAVAGGKLITQEIKDRLSDLISDSSADVRAMAARAIKDINYVKALDRILAQLQQERNPEVEIALLQAVARLGDLKAVPVLRNKLHDPSLRVATQAAEALRSLGPQLFQTDPQKAKDVSQELDRVMRQRTGAPGQPVPDVQAQEFRAAVVAAAAPLADQDLRDTFRQLLDPREPKATRIAALQALGSLGETAAEFVAHELEPGVEPDADVRLAALDAMARGGSFLYARQLDALMRPENEPNPDVQKRAWVVFQALLSTGSTQDLSEWQNQFKRRGDPNRESVVLRALCDKLLKAGDVKNLAAQDENLADLLLSPKIDQPEAAVPYLKRALDYWQRQRGVQGPVTEHLIDSLLSAYLRSRKYEDAIAFAEESIRNNPRNQPLVGPRIRNAAEALTNSGEKGDAAAYRDAARLIDDALKMNPRLDPQYQEDLVRDKNKIPPSATSLP